MLSCDDAARRQRRDGRHTGQLVQRLLACLRRRGRVKAPLADASLVNGWGLSAGPTTPWWTSNNRTNTSTLYSGAGVKSALTVSVPGGPTGTVFNGNAAAFIVSAERQERLRALPLRDRRRGRSSAGRRPSTQPTAVIGRRQLLDRARSTTGLATLNDRLYATDFHNARVDVFDQLRSRHARQRLRRQADPEGLGAVRHPGARTGTSSSPTRSRIAAKTTSTSPAAGSATSTSSTPDGALSHASPSAGSRRRR